MRAIYPSLSLNFMSSIYVQSNGKRVYKNGPLKGRRAALKRIFCFEKKKKKKNIASSHSQDNYDYENKKSFSTGDPENSGFNRIQLGKGEKLGFRLAHNHTFGADSGIIVACLTLRSIVALRAAFRGSAVGSVR